MTMKKFIPLAVLLPMVLSACAGKHRPETKQSDMFVTNIKYTNDKVFNFSIGSNQEKGDRGKNKSQRGGRGGPPPDRNNSRKTDSEDTNENSLNALYSRLDLKLNETGYCREGYVEIDTYESENRFHILGKCNESATPEDKSRFVNDFGY